MNTAPLATLFASPALRAAFANGAADALDAFMVPVTQNPPRPRTVAVAARKPRPVLVGGAAAVRELEFA